jgi:HlyD family secretion protein
MMTSRLQRDGTVPANEVFMTVVAPRPFFIRATADEKDLHWLRPGLAGRAVLTGYPDLKLPAKLVQLSTVPREAGTFEARIAVEPGEGTAALMPGMACTVKFVPYRKDDALTVPASVVFTDGTDDGAHYVYCLNKNGKPEKRAVKVGKTVGDKTEVLEGLQPGDRIQASKPEGQ